MSETKFTGGPWQSHNGYSVEGVCQIIGAIDGPDEGRMHYKTVCSVNEESPNYEADAALIAAAPDLYEALKQLASWKDAVETCAPELGGISRAFYAAQEALAKAEGQQ